MKFSASSSLIFSIASFSTLVVSIPLNPSTPRFADLADRDTASGSDAWHLFERDDPDREFFRRDLALTESYDLSGRNLHYANSGDLLERDIGSHEPWYGFGRDVNDQHEYNTVFGRDNPKPKPPPKPKSKPPPPKQNKHAPEPKPPAPPPPKAPTGRGSGAGGAAIGDALANLFIGLEKEPGLRGDFVKHLIDTTTKAKPGFHAIACHPKHDYKFEGTRGKDWDHSHAEYPKDATPGTIGYEIYWFKKGTFENKGDGGWQNWAYTGNPKKEGDKKLIYS